MRSRLIDVVLITYIQRAVSCEDRMEVGVKRLSVAVLAMQSYAQCNDRTKAW
jgi:hypothetical protein